MFVLKTMRGSVVALLASMAFCATAWAGPVDVNHADAATIAKELKGVGAAKAQAIVQYREKHGSFKSADDLTQVKGIGAKMVAKNRANIRLGETSKK